MNLKIKKIRLSSFQLHLFAMFLMLIDHIGAVFYPFDFLYRYIGRLSFPIFCYLLVQGFYKTYSRKKYFLRLLLFAILSEIPFDLAFSNSFICWSSQNVMWMFCIAFCMLCVVEKVKYRKIYFIPIILFIFCFIAYIFKVDYSWYGVLIICIFYFTNNLNIYLRRFLQMFGMIIINCVLFKGILVNYGNFFLYSQPFAVLSLFFIWLSDEKQGYHNVYIKYFNYLFYPIHLLILFFINNLIYLI